MRNLINFLIKYSIVFLFLFLEIISLIMIVKNGGYHKSIYLTSSNMVVSSIYGVNNSIVEFFKLKGANETLSEENTALKNELILMKNKLNTVLPRKTDSLNFKIPPEMEFNFISAKVINSSTNKIQNYITLNKGFSDGIQVDMGVISEEGVVGLIKTVSENFSVVIPILNDRLKINCKFSKSNYCGPLQWSGLDYRYADLGDIARHVEFSLGDSLVTSGFTNAFPQGIPVGTIEDFYIKSSDAYYSIKVKLAVNFRTLSYVKVVRFFNLKEQKYLEKVAEQ